MRPSSSSTMPISIAAVEGAIASKFRNGGQTCVCANRILVQAGVYDAFAERLAARVRAMKVGPGTAPGVDDRPDDQRRRRREDRRATSRTRWPRARRCSPRPRCRDGPVRQRRWC